jgi:pyruvate,water dikinase
MSFHRRFKSLMRVYGYRTGWGFGASTDFDGPNWNMQPQKPLDLIASYAQQDLDELDRLEADALRERQLSTARIRRRLAREPERRSRFEFDRARAQRDLVSMEDHNHLMEQCTVGQLREAMYLMGRAMVKRRILEVPNDVLHLSIDELKAISEGRGPEDVPELVRERRAEREERARLRPPATLGQEPAPEDEYGSNPDEPSNSGLDGNIIRGTAASRGRATGPARLVLPGAQMRRIRRGDILVAENIGADWTPVMPLLGGIVLDGGAVSQHAALVAREYRIPAVILTGNATTSIVDGQTITVDGDSGIVELDV